MCVCVCERERERERKRERHLSDQSRINGTILSLALLSSWAHTINHFSLVINTKGEVRLTVRSWGLYYKTFYGRNLRIFVIS